MKAVNAIVYGGIRHKAVGYDVPVVLMSDVSLGEAVAVWMASIKKVGREARLARELAMRK